MTKQVIDNLLRKLLSINMNKNLILIVVLCAFCFTAKSQGCDANIIVPAEEACVGSMITITGFGEKTTGCLNEFTQKIEIVKAPNGADPDAVLSEDGTEITVKFDKSGVYRFKYTFTDAEGCSNTEPCVAFGEINIIEPAARFPMDTIVVCKGLPFDVGVQLLGATGGTVTDNASFTKGIVLDQMDETRGIISYTDKVQESFTLYITKADKASINCFNSLPEGEYFDSIVVIALEELAFVPIGDPENPECDLANENYFMKFKLTGGLGNYSIDSSADATLSGDTLTTFIRPSGEPYSISVFSDDVCGLRTAIDTFKVEGANECACIVNAGAMPSDAVFACANDKIELSYDSTLYFGREIDNLLFILHNTPGDTIIDFLSVSDQPFFSSEGLVDSQLFVSAVVGPFTIEDFDLASSSCFNISPGTPITWRSDEVYDIGGNAEFCATEQNRMYSIENDTLKPGSSQFWYLEDQANAFIEGQNSERAFVSFTGTGDSKLYLQSDFQLNDSTTCVTLDSLTVTNNGMQAQPVSNVIFWPGEIFASTSDGPCYQWGSITTTGKFSMDIFDGENDKFFYAKESVLTDFADVSYFVAVYDSPGCEFSMDNCNSIIFYNPNLLPGLNVDLEDDFDLDIMPNPNDGTFRLELKGSFRGQYIIEVYNDLGQKINGQVIEKEYNLAIKDIDLNQAAEGLYYIVITNELGEREVVKTVITR